MSLFYRLSFPIFSLSSLLIVVQYPDPPAPFSFWAMGWLGAIAVLLIALAAGGVLLARLRTISGQKRQRDLQVGVITQELQKSNARFQVFSEATRDGILVCEGEIITDINNVILEMFGYSRENLLGNHFHLLFTQEGSEEVSRRVQEGFPEPFDVEGQRKDESTFPLEVQISPVPHPGESPFSVIVLRDLTEARQAQETIQELTITDPLTGLYNRRYFTSRAVREFEEASRYNRPLSIVLFDIHHLQYINDTYGRLIGDQVLAGVGALLQNNTRRVDILGRYQGDVYVVLLPEIEAFQAGLYARRMSDIVNTQPLQTDIGMIMVSLTSGIAELDGKNTDTLDKLLSHAEQALYEARRAGGNLIKTYEAA